MTSSLNFSFIDWKSPVNIPPRLPNGGLYTGETAKGDWGNIPIIPDANVYASHLNTINSPPEIQKQATSFERPGNNPMNHPYHVYYDNKSSEIKCIQ